MKNMNRIISVRNPKSPIAEAYRGIRTSIEFSNLDKELKVINVTSSTQNEGKSTVIANLAVSFANLDKKVLIMEGDLRNPSVHRMFNISNVEGLTDILLGNKNFTECVHCTEVRNLHVLTCGPIPPNPSEMLSSKKIKDFVESLRDYYDYVFIDAPPIGIVTDAGIISSYTDGCIFVVGAGEADIEMAKVSKERLEKVGANIDDVVKGMKFDIRIGDKFFNAGIGYGGSCFPKDTKALYNIANNCDYELRTIKAAIDVNESQKLKLIEKANKIVKSFDGLNVAILGVTFKPGTDDMREAPSISNIKYLIDNGANVRVYDPIGTDNCKKIFKNEPKIIYTNTIDDAIKDSQLCLIMTEWDEIVNYDLNKYKNLMKNPIVLDGRNCYNLNEVAKLDIKYYSIGR